MSTSIKVNWSCECRPERTTGYIDSDTDSVRCSTCDGIISTASELTLADLEKYDKAYQAWAFDNYGEDMDYLDIEREIDEIRQEQADE